MIAAVYRREPDRIVLELPLAESARRAFLRAAYRRAARALRDQLGYPGAALALDLLAESLRTPERCDFDGEEATVVDVPWYASLRP